jgi:uncharacterized protein (DUF1330 family)
MHEPAGDFRHLRQIDFLYRRTYSNSTCKATILLELEYRRKGIEAVETYIIFTREEPIQDEAAMQAYRDINASGPRTEGLEALVIYGEITGLEGETPDGAVVLKFPDRATALKWYNSPKYQEAIKHRTRAAKYRAFMVEGLSTGAGPAR